MIQLYDNKGIPRGILLMMAVVGGLTVANLYYNQPLLEEIRANLRISEVEANLITVMTQIGYALGLIFVVPMADIWSRRRIIMTNMSVAVVMALTIALAGNVAVVWGASVVLGACSVVPQMFVPMAGQFSRPEDKSKNMGIVQSGLLMGVLGARVISGYLGGWLGWRWMFGVAAVIMLLCLLVSLRVLPKAKPTYEGNYRGLMRTVVTIFLTHPRMRLYALRALFSFGSMMAIWSCIAFHLAGEPFHAGSDTVGMLGLCGVAGSMAASVVGKYVPRFGIQRISVLGSCLQMLAWLTAYFLGHTYGGIIVAIMLVDIGAQCQQLSNQSGCLAEVPGASNRANTIFMTSLFTGGCMGTFAAGMVWGSYGWTGICAVGMVFCLCSMMVSAYTGKNVAETSRGRHRLEHEKRTVSLMIGIYCRGKHTGQTAGLCPDCQDLQTYALRHLDHCRFGEQKPACKKCPVHCYRPDMRGRIRDVMRYAGPRMLWRHPIAALRHLFG